MNPRGSTGKDVHEFVSFLGETIESKFKNVTKAFRFFDQNHDGRINWIEFKKALSNLYIRLREPQIKEIFNAIDENQDGEIDYDEFSKIFIASKQRARNTSTERKSLTPLKGQMSKPRPIAITTKSISFPRFQRPRKYNSLPRSFTPQSVSLSRRAEGSTRSWRKQITETSINRRGFSIPRSLGRSRTTKFSNLIQQDHRKSFIKTHSLKQSYIKLSKRERNMRYNSSRRLNTKTSTLRRDYIRQKIS